jgi:hypothetical protein
MKVDSEKRMPSSTVSTPPTLSLRESFSLGEYWE